MIYNTANFCFNILHYFLSETLVAAPYISEKFRYFQELVLLGISLINLYNWLDLFGRFLTACQ